jgi:hypothetical protein
MTSDEKLQDSIGLFNEAFSTALVIYHQNIDSDNHDL